MKRIPKPEHASFDWRMKRHRDNEGRCVFGASEAGAVMGVSEFTSRPELYASKIDDPIITPPTPAMLKGIYFEDGLGAFAAHELGLELHQPQEMFAHGRWVSTLDYATHDLSVIAECKVTSAHTVDSATDLPSSWVMQGHVQHYCTGAQIFFSVFDRRQRLSVHQLEIKPWLIDELNEMAELLGSAVDERTIPDWLENEMNADMIQRLIPIDEGKRIEADAELVDWISDLEQAKKMKKQAEEAEQFARDQIASRMRDAEYVMCDGITVLSWKQQKGRSRFDSDTFKANHPDLFAKYTVQGAPIRVMRFGKGNK